MNRKYLISFIAGLSVIALVGATFKSLMLDESGNCGQSVNFTGTTMLNGLEVATQAYSNDVVTSHNSDGAAHSTEFAAKQNTITASGILKGAGAGSVSAAVAGTDYVTPHTTLSGYGITDAVLSSSISVDSGLAEDSDSLIPSQKAVKYYVDNNGGAVSSVFGKTGAVANISDSSGYLKNDGSGNFSYDNPSGSGDVTGPASSTDGNVVTFNGATGKIIKDSGLTLSGSNTGDETTSTIKTKLGAAATGADGYLTSTDWNTFNGKQSGFTILSTFGNLSSSAGYLYNDGAGTLSYASPSAGMTNPMTTAGDIIYGGSSGTPTRLGVGTDGQVLTLASGVPTWATASSGSGSTDDTSWTGSNWSSTTSSPSQRAVEEVVKDVAVRYDDRASAGTTNTNGKLVKQYVGGDTNTVLLLHCDGTDASTTFTDSSVYAKTVTANGNAQLDTAQYKFATASCLLDGSGDYLSMAYSTDFNFAADNFTVDFWFRAAALNSGNHYLYGGRSPDSYANLIIMQSSSNLVFYSSSNGTSWDVASAVSISSSLSTDTWYHVAVAREGTSLRYFLNGNLVGTVTTSATLYNSTNTLLIGASSSGENFNGWIDEIRVSKGVARYTASFTPETSAYTLATTKDFRLSSLSESDINFGVCQGRLTLESGVPVSITDQTAKTTLYFTPNVTGPNPGNKIALYNGASWSVLTFTEASLSLSGLTANTIYDIYGYDYNGTLTLSVTAWTDATTRATALYAQDGIYVKTGATNYRYLGTIRITSTTGQCEDSISKRFVWNMYNREERESALILTGSWTYATAAWRAINGDATKRVGIVTGVPQTVTYNMSIYASKASGSYPSAAIGYDSTTAPAAKTLFSMVGLASVIPCSLTQTMTAGYHYFQMLENARDTTTTTFYGIYQDSGSVTIMQSGISGKIKN